MVTTHSLILAELVKYESGRFRCVYNETATDVFLALTKHGWQYVGPSGVVMENVYADHAHRNIREAAFRAARRWCKERDCALEVDDLFKDSTTRLTAMSSVDDMDDPRFVGNIILGTGPTDADALLEVMRTINANGGK